METQSHVTLVTKIVVSILWGIFSLVVGGYALYQHFTN